MVYDRAQWCHLIYVAYLTYWVKTLLLLLLLYYFCHLYVLGCRHASVWERWNECLEIWKWEYLISYMTCQCTDILQRIFPYVWSPSWSFNSEHPVINGFKCLFTEDGFSRIRFKFGFPPISLVSSCKLATKSNIEWYFPSKITYLKFWPSSG